MIELFGKQEGFLFTNTYFSENCDTINSLNIVSKER